MRTRLSICIVISLLLTGCSASATATPIHIEASPTAAVTPTIQATPTAIIVIPTLESTVTSMATIVVQESTATSQPTDIVPTLQMVIVSGSQPTDVVSQPQTCQHPQNWVLYTVQRNDTLSSLAQRTGIGWQQIQTANCLSGITIFAGQRLYLPFIPAPPVITQMTSVPPPQAPPPPPPGDPRIEVVPGSGSAGSTFILKLRDFDPSAVITVKIEASDGTIISSFPVTMDTTGQFDVAWVSPANLTIGFYTVRPIKPDGTQGKSGTITIVP